MSATIKKMVFIFLGAFTMAIGATYFYVPYDLAAGGISGLSIIINHIYPQLSVGGLMNMGNILFFIIGFIFLGRSFGIFTIFGAFSYSIPVYIMEHYFQVAQPVTDSPIVAMAIGAILHGIGLAIVFQQNASTGGSDIIVKIMNVYMGINLAAGVTITDGVVVMLSGMFISMNQALYAVLAILLQSVVLDYVIAGYDRRLVMNIITQNKEAVCDYIMHDIQRGVTLTQARGGFSKKNQEIIVTIVQKQEYTRIRTFMEEHDPKAFVYVYNANEVMGEGFTLPRALGAAQVTQNSVPSV